MGNALDIEQGGGGGTAMRPLGVETDETRQLDGRAIHQLGSAKLRRQDETLLMIGHTADRLNAIGQTIGREIDEQTPLMGKLAGGVEGSTERINKASRQVRAQADAGGAPWCLWYTIVILFLVLLVVIFFAMLF